MSRMTTVPVPITARDPIRAPPVSGARRGRYLFLPGTGTDRCGMVEEEAGTETFLGCFGFLVSRLLRCWPFGI
jgi:hypothetical protein